MLSDVPVHTTIPAADLDRACRFYGEALGFSEIRRLSGGVMFSAGDGIDKHDFPGLRTVNGIADRDDIRSAWFKDTEGNILGIVQLPPQ